MQPLLSSKAEPGANFRQLLSMFLIHSTAACCCHTGGIFWTWPHTSKGVIESVLCVPACLCSVSALFFVVCFLQLILLLWSYFPLHFHFFAQPAITQTCYNKSTFLLFLRHLNIKLEVGIQYKYHSI